MDPGIYSRILSLLEEGTSHDLRMSDSGPDRAPEALLTVNRESSSSMSLKCTPDYVDTSEDDMNSIKSVPIEKRAPESQELAVSVYDQETLEKGILQQLDEALPKEKVRKMGDLQMKSVQAEMTTMKKEVINNETFPKSLPSKDILSDYNEGLLLRRKTDQDLSKISDMQAKAETLSRKRDQSTLPSSGNDAANECSAGVYYGDYEMELLSSNNDCGRPVENVVTELQKMIHLEDINSKIKNGGFTPLFFAIRENHLERVNFLIARGADVSHKAIHGFTPLSLAIQLGYLNIVNLLIANGADLSTRTDKLNTHLHLAAESDHLDIVNVLIVKGLDVNAVNDDRARPLHSAVENCNLGIVKALISHGSDINAGFSGAGNHKMDVNVTALHLAAQTGRLDIVKALLEAGANVNVKTGDRITPLHLASQYGSVEVVDILIRNKANVNARDYENVTPLHLASERNHFGVVKSLLLMKGIDVNAKSHNNTTALHIASQNGHLKVVKLLIENKANVNAKNYEGFTPLHLAIQQRHFEVSDFLIKNEANISAMDDQNWTPLHNAAYNGFSLKIVESLIAKGANVNAKMDDGKRALHLASEHNHLEIVNFLIKNGAVVIALDRKRWTPLHCAAYDGNLEVVKSLLEKGAGINAKTERSTTPLHFAVINDHVEVVDWLLNQGAEVNALDHTNWTPLHFAAEKGCDRMTTVLIKHGADVHVKESQNKCTALHLAVQYCHPKVVRTLIINGADVNAKMDQNATPLHLGAQIGNLEIVRSLLMSGAYFNARADAGRYVLPLHFAERRGNPGVIKLLQLVEKLFKAIAVNNYSEIESSIRDGAIVDSKNVDGRTPLHLAVHNGHIKVVKLLLANGADATKVTNKGNTPLHSAASKGDKEMIEALLQHVSLDKLSDFVNAKTVDKSTTSLHVATEKSFFEAVKYLLKHGAIYNIKNKEGKTPLDFSQDQNITNLLKLIDELFEDSMKGNVEIISKVKAIKPDERVAVMNSRDDHGKTLVQVAITNKHSNLAKRLLEIIRSPDLNLEN